MVQLSLGEVLHEPLFMDVFTVIRRSETISDYGRSKTVNIYHRGINGIVSPASSKQLERLRDYDIQGKAISIVTNFKIRGSSKNTKKRYKPDIICWGSDYYVVSAIDDNSRYGEGWIHALASSTDFVDTSPAEEIETIGADFSESVNSGYIPCLCQ